MHSIDREERNGCPKESNMYVNIFINIGKVKSNGNIVTRRNSAHTCEGKKGSVLFIIRNS